MNNEREKLLKKIESNINKTNIAYEKVAKLMRKIYGNDLMQKNSMFEFNYEGLKDKTIDELKEIAKNSTLRKLKEEQYKVLKTDQWLITAEIESHQVRVGLCHKLLKATYKIAKKRLSKGK